MACCGLNECGVKKRQRHKRVIAHNQTMSSIASFYVLSNVDLPTLTALAAQPPRRLKRRVLWFTFNRARWHDPFWNYIHTNARELEEYAWSGHVLAGEVWFLLQMHSLD